MDDRTYSSSKISKPSSWSVAGVVGLVIMVITTGCRSVPLPSQAAAESNAVSVIAEHWWDGPREVPIPDQGLTLASGLAQSWPGRPQEVINQSINEIAQSYDGVNADLQAHLEKLAKIDLVRISRGNHDWLIPWRLLGEANVAGIQLRPGDRLASLPIDVTVFGATSEQAKADTRSLRELAVFIRGPLAEQQGKLTWTPRYKSAAWYVDLDQITDQPFDRIEDVVPDTQFLPDSPASGSLALSTLPQATAIVVTRIEPQSGRFQHLLLPTWRDEDHYLITKSLVGNANHILQPADIITITNLNLWAAEMQGNGPG